MKECMVLWMLVLLVSQAWSLPQCLDFRAPFESEAVEFCSQYAAFGCCTADEDLAIQKEHSRIVSDTENKQGVMGCGDTLKQVMCLRCSPYAAQIYGAQGSQVQRAFPGLCGDFCAAFYDNCNVTIAMLTDDQGTLASKDSKDAFCQHIALPQTEYCYPELENDEELKKNIEKETIEEAGCVCLEEIASGLRNPVVLEVPPDGTHRMFVAEQKGVVYIYHPNKTRNPEPFLNLTSIVHVSSLAGDEKGFLGLTFHPEYSSNRRLFVVYYLNQNETHKVRLSEFRAQPDNMDKIDADSERVLLETVQPYENQNGGEVLFGTDGYLYMFLGDGGSEGDPHDRAQDLQSLLGKVIRLDVDSPTPAGSEYAIPKDNPFVAQPDVRPEIYAYGFRNPWRCDVDEGDSETMYGRGRIICGDVGHNRFEEIDIILPGRNYGWNLREGLACFPDNEVCEQQPDEELPIHVYPHSEGKAIQGGHVYRGCLMPNFYGKFLYGDFLNGALWTLQEDRSEGVWRNSELNTCGPDVCTNGLTGDYVPNILSFGEDADGEIYMLSTSYASPKADAGIIYKFVDPRRRGNPATCRSNMSQEGTTPPDMDKTTVAGTKQTRTVSGLLVILMVLRITMDIVRVNRSFLATFL